MTDIDVRIEGRAGRITLNRPQALNALTYDMVREIEAALDAWRHDDAVALVIIDAVGDKAFCAGGDLGEMYRSGASGDYSYGHRFWRDEYRLNAKIADYPKPYIALMQGFTMGGGVGVACHGSHRIVGESSRIAMPECSVGLVPDVGGSYLLSRAPGRLGEYLGMTGSRMDAADAIHAGFADIYVPQDQWAALVAALVSTGDPVEIDGFARQPDTSRMAAEQAAIDRAFGHDTPAGVVAALDADADLGPKALAGLRRGSPLSVACTMRLVAMCRLAASVAEALELEYRFSHRCMADGDFIEGIRAIIIDKDQSPAWRHARVEDVTAAQTAAMLAPLGDETLTLS